MASITRKAISKYRDHPILGAPLKWLGLTREDSIVIPTPTRAPRPRPFEGFVFERPNRASSVAASTSSRRSNHASTSNRRGGARPLRRANSSLTLMKERIARRERSEAATAALASVAEDDSARAVTPQPPGGFTDYTEIARDMEDTIMRSPTKPSMSQQIALREIKTLAHTQYWGNQLTKARQETSEAIKRAKVLRKVRMERLERERAAQRQQAARRFVTPPRSHSNGSGSTLVPPEPSRSTPASLSGIRRASGSSTNRGAVPDRVREWTAEQARIRQEEEEERARNAEDTHIREEADRFRRQEEHRLFDEVIAQRLRVRQEENARLAAEAQAERLRREAGDYQVLLEAEKRRRQEAEAAAEAQRAREREELARVFSEREARIRYALEREASFIQKHAEALRQEKLAHEARRARDHQEILNAQQATQQMYDQILQEVEARELAEEVAAQQQYLREQWEQQQQWQREYQAWQEQQQQHQQRAGPSIQLPSTSAMDIDDQSMRDPTPSFEAPAVGEAPAFEETPPFAAQPPPPPPPPPQPQPALNRDPSVRTLFGIYEAKWDALRTAAPNSVRFTDIPWPILSKNPIQLVSDLTKAKVLRFLLHEKRPGWEGKSLRARVKPEILRYHPDKFAQVLGTKIHNDDLEMIIEGVGVVSRYLIDIHAGKA